MQLFPECASDLSSRQPEALERELPQQSQGGAVSMLTCNGPTGDGGSSGDLHQDDTCRAVLPVYEGHRWYFIEEHIHDVLGKLDLESGRHEAALRHFAAIIACPSSPAYWQAFYLQQFLDCVRTTAKSQVAASYRLHLIWLQRPS